MTKFDSHVRLSELSELQRYLNKPKKERKPKKKIIKFKRIKRSYSEWHRLLVLKLRYTNIKSR